ncbi:MAG TPA: hypothetical protein PK176_12780 [Acidobacteriota bacterium]|nr:hypothetical protein [Acidobacteriota bacterium]HQM64180.1 hypothetical protein [Acidobacteriota bacterium]
MRMDTAYQASQLMAVIGQAAGVLAAGVTAVILTRRRRRPWAAWLLVVGWCGWLLRDLAQLAVVQLLYFGLFAAWSGLATDAIGILAGGLIALAIALLTRPLRPRGRSEVSHG